jgi:hypothetical protein
VPAPRTHPRVVFNDNGAIYRPGNGRVIRYRKVGGIYYHANAPDAVVEALEQARARRQRIRIHYGDARTGRDWLEEHDVEGRFGNSMGPLKVPLLIHNSRSHGGSALLDHCIVRIKTTGNRGRVLYKHPRYHAGSFSIREIGAADACHGENLRRKGFTHAVDVDGQNHANFRSLAAAERFVRRMTA